MTRFTTSGNSAHWRTPAYQRTCRVPGPIVGMDYPRPSLFARLFRRASQHKDT